VDKLRLGKILINCYHFIFSGFNGVTIPSLESIPGESNLVEEEETNIEMKKICDETKIVEKSPNKFWDVEQLAVSTYSDKYTTPPKVEELVNVAD
jgi:hypothetical protein